MISRCSVSSKIAKDTLNYLCFGYTPRSTIELQYELEKLWEGSKEMTDLSSGLVLSGIFSLVVFIPLAIFLLYTEKRLRNYQTGQCRIVAKRVLKERALTSSGPSYETTRPDFDFIVQTADDQQYQAQGYDTLKVFTQWHSRNQAIVDSYKVGETYPCWYNPKNPTQAVLIKKPYWTLRIMVGGFFINGWILLLWGSLLAWH